MNLDVEYIILYVLLLVVSYICGKKISRGVGYWNACVPLIFIYTFVTGSRYGRGSDYFMYVDIFNNGLDYEQTAFDFFISIIKWFKINAYNAYYVYSLIFIVCSLHFLKKFRQYAICIFPVFVLSTLLLEEQFVRQVLSLSIVYISLDYINSSHHLFKTSKRHVIILLFIWSIAVSFHFANIVIIIAFVLFFFFLNNAIRPSVSIPFYLLAIFFLGNKIDMSGLEGVMMYFNVLGERAENYVNNFGEWFSDEGMEDKYLRNPFILIYEMVGNISLMYLGYRLICEHFPKNNYISSFYNCYILGAFVLSAFRTFELLNRIGSIFLSFNFVPLGLVLYYRKSLVRNDVDRVAFFFLTWWAYDFLKFLFFTSTTDFIWNVKTAIL